MPPAKPWTMRAATSVEKPVLAAQAAEARVNRPRAAVNRPRMVKARVRKPVSGIAITSAIR